MDRNLSGLVFEEDSKYINENLLRRAFIAMMDKDWSEASKILEKFSEPEREDYRYWIARLMCYFKVPKEERLSRLESDFSQNTYYRRALKYADGQTREKLEKYCYCGLYTKAMNEYASAEDGNYSEWLINTLQTLSGYLDADILLKKIYLHIDAKIEKIMQKTPEHKRTIEIRNLLKLYSQYEKKEELLKYCDRLEHRNKYRQAVKQFLCEKSSLKSKEIWLEAAEKFKESGDWDYVMYSYKRAKKYGLNENDYTHRMDQVAKELDKMISEKKEGNFYKGIFCVFRMDDFSTAAEYFDRAYKNEEEYGYLAKGLLYYRKGFEDYHEHDYGKAKDYLWKAAYLRSDPDSRACYAHICKKMGDDAEAAKMYRSIFWWSDDGRYENFCGNLYYGKEQSETNLQQNIVQMMDCYELAIKKGNSYGLLNYATMVNDYIEDVPDYLIERDNFWLKLLDYSRRAYEAGKYEAAYVYVQFIRTDIENNPAFKKDLKKASQVIFCAYEKCADDSRILHSLVQSVVEYDVPNQKSWEWIIEKIDELLVINEEYQEDEEYSEVVAELKKYREIVESKMKKSTKLFQFLKRGAKNGR